MSPAHPAETTHATDDLVVALLYEPFTLWWEMHQNPDLRNHPLVNALDGHVLHANPAARRKGITPGLRVANARMRAPDLAVTEAETARLHPQWSWQLERLAAHSPRLQSPTIGRAWLALSEDEARHLAAEHHVRAGAADFIEPALAAALVTLPGDLRTVPRGEERTFLGRIPVNRLPGLGFSSEVAGRFCNLGIRRLADLFHWKEPHLRSIAGDQALQLLTLLHGPWTPQVPVYRPESALKASHTFREPVAEPFVLEPAIIDLATRLTCRLHGRVSSRVIVTSESSLLRIPDEIFPREPLHDAGILMRLIWRSLNTTGAASLGIESLTVELSGLATLQEQHGLWPQKEAWSKAVRVVSRRFPGALLAFEEVDPHSMAQDRRYQLFRLDTGEVVSRKMVAPAAPVTSPPRTLAEAPVLAAGPLPAMKQERTEEYAGVAR